MAQEGSEASVTSTSSTPNWWDIHANPLASWSAVAPWHHHRSDPASGEEDHASASFANATSGHSAQSTADSAEPVDTHLWSHLLLGVGNANPQVGHRKPLVSAAAMLDPSSDYLRKLGSWQLPHREMERVRIDVPDSSSSSSYLISPSYHDVHHQQTAATSHLLRQLCDDGAPYHDGFIKENYAGLVDTQDAVPWPSSRSTRTFTDLISFGSSINKSIVLRSKPLPQDPSSTPTRRNGEGKNRRSEDGSDVTSTKKPKQETSKLQLPKVKLADKITALQQIVAPFGKTDTASVLLEAINHIRFLHEQVQLLSDPYMKSGSVMKVDRNMQKDLNSRGLCLVPVACTPQACHENTGPDYWTPTYRGYLYR